MTNLSPSTGQSPHWKWALVTGLLMTLVTIGIYHTVLRADFLELDDPLLVRDNSAVHAMNTATIQRIFTSYDPELYIPLTFLSYQLDWQLGSGAPAIFHLTNLLLHCLNAVLVLLLFERLTRDRLAASIGALLFALHPLEVGTVAWIASRKDLLSTFFLLGSLLTYFLHRERKSTVLLVSSLVLFAAALLSKVSVLILPLLLLLLDDVRGRNMKAARTWLSKLPYFLLSLVFGLVALGGKTETLGKTTLASTLTMIPRTIFLYASKLLWPVGLSIKYVVDPPITLMDPAYVVPLILLLGLFALLPTLHRRWRLAFFGIAFSLVALLPTFLEYAESGIGAGTGRYAYLPSIGLFLLVTVGFSLAWEKVPRHLRDLLIVLTVAIVMALGIRSYDETQKWQNTLTVFQNEEMLHPRWYLPPFTQGIYFAHQRMWNAAIQKYEQARHLKPSDVQTLSNLGAAYGTLGAREKEISLYQEALHIDPTFVAARLNLAMAEIDAGNTADALIQVRAALRVDPWNVDGERILRQLQGTK